MKMIESELDPDIRAIDEPTGSPIVVDGKTWLLAWGGVARVLDRYRDAMDDQSRLDDQVNMSDVVEAGMILLSSNYELSADEAIRLLGSADRGELANAVMAAMFGDANPRRTYTSWALTSMYAAGLDPDKIPAEWVAPVLDMLVSTKRAVPISEYSDAAIASRRFAQARARVARQVERAPSSAPSPT